MIEEWRKIKGLPNYEISNYGRVKSLSYRGGKSECILKSNSCDKYKHQQIRLSGKMYLVHRLVVMAFPEICGVLTKGFEIDHIDCDPTNNIVTNLRIVNHSQNMNNPNTTSKISKPIIQMDKDGKLIWLWNSSMDIKRKTNFDRGNIGKCCNGVYKTAGGYKWMYVEDYLSEWWDKEMDKYMEKAV